MKKIILTYVLALSCCMFAQTNTYTVSTFVTTTITPPAAEFDNFWVHQICGINGGTLKVTHWRISVDGNQIQSAVIFHRMPRISGGSGEAALWISGDQSKPVSKSTVMSFSPPAPFPNSGLPPRLRTFVVNTNLSDMVIGEPITLVGSNDCISMSPYSFVIQEYFSEVEWTEGP